MDDPDHKAVSMLLPSSVVSIYTTDSDTMESAKYAMNDWRFARVQIQIIQGDINTAIQTCARESAADLIIIQTETTAGDLTTKLEDLAAQCDEGTAAILIGPVNDVNLYRALVDMGVSDYLVAPVGGEDLTDIIAKTLVDRLGVSDSRLVAFIGAKGGVGTSVLTQAAAWSAADILKQKTILLDGAGGWSSMSVGLGFEPSTTLAEAATVAAAEDEDALARMIITPDDHLSVLGSGGDAMLDPTLRTDQIEDLMGMLMVKYPVVMVDLSMTPPVLQKTVLMRASQIFVVSTPVLPALRLARGLIQEITTLRGEQKTNIDLVINMQGLDKAREVSLKDIKTAMETVPSTVISFDSNMFMKGESEGLKITSRSEGQKLMQSTLVPLLRQALSLKSEEQIGVWPAKKGWFDGLRNMFKNRK